MVKETREQGVPDDPIESPLDLHRKINSQFFHTNHSARAVIRQDGLLLDPTTRRSTGVSQFQSRQNIAPDFYRLFDGVTRPGSAAGLIAFAESLPGLQVEYLKDLQSFTRGFLSSAVSQKALNRHFVEACKAMQTALNVGESTLCMQDSVVLGAYGIVAFSKRTDKLGITYEDSVKPDRSLQSQPITYAPGDVAVACNCDYVFYSGTGSPSIGGKAMAVVEVRITPPNKFEDYHKNTNAIIAQIFTSMIGAEAPIGLILGYKMFKFFWMEKQDDGSLHVFDYPSGNDMADMADSSDFELLTKILFQLVRCSVQSDKVDSPVSKRVKVDEADTEGLTLMTTYGVPVKVGKYDVSKWSFEEREAFRKDERRKKSDISQP